MIFDDDTDKKMLINRAKFELHQSWRSDSGAVYITCADGIIARTEKFGLMPSQEFIALSQIHANSVIYAHPGMKNYGSLKFIKSTNIRLNPPELISPSKIYLPKFECYLFLVPVYFRGILDKLDGHAKVLSIERAEPEFNKKIPTPVSTKFSFEELVVIINPNDTRRAIRLLESLVSNPHSLPSSIRSLFGLELNKTKRVTITLKSGVRVDDPRIRLNKYWAFDFDGTNWEAETGFGG